MNRAVFLDRDGVLNEEKNYLHRVEDFVLFPGVPAALARLAAAGFQLFIVTNQSGVGRGYFTMDDVEKLHAHLRAQLSRDRIVIRKIYIAPEAPDQPSHGSLPPSSSSTPATNTAWISVSAS
jgi:D-glycero-D-manno-heptose 1,7-bisphosphate phosphatase